MNDGAIYLAAPPGTSWPLGIPTLDHHLQERFPDLLARVEHAPERDQHHLDFQVVLDGLPRSGTYFQGARLVLRDAPPRLWADTIAWFLALLPHDAEVVAMLETNPECIASVPGAATAEEITAMFEALERPV
ncbi:MAG: hypothetical protein ACJ786_18920 [Catenulispora sp.]